jgi:shikimate dehydrogenase
VKRYGLIGYPLSHSFSKKFFTDKFEREGRKDCVYDLFPIASIDELPGIISANKDLQGLNVTIPYKQQVLQYLTQSRLPANVSACNCIRINNGNLEGFNTDITGFEKSFTPQLKPSHKSALVLGNGGATVAVVAALEKLGISYTIVSRKIKDPSHFTYEQVGEDQIRENKIIINTTPVGMYPDVDVCPPLPYEYIGPEHYLFDLVYNPAKTLFLRKGEEVGAVIKNGEDMLVIQAEESWKIWNSE